MKFSKNEDFVEIDEKKFKEKLIRVGSHTTCYMNVILQVLYAVNKFRNIVFELETDEDNQIMK